MQNKTLMLKLIAVTMALILSLSNFLVLVSYAAEISTVSSVDLTSQDSKTNNKNISFDSYFKQNGNNVYSAMLNVEDENKLYINIKLSNKGYLKTGTINFEEESFNIKNQEESATTIQNIDYSSNQIILNQINKGTEVELEIPIEIAKNEIYNIQKLNNNNKVLFTGTYVTEKGKEIEIEKEIYLGLKWDANVEGILEQSISKYVREIEGKTLIEVRLSSGLNKNIMPIKETATELEVPEIEGKLPVYVNVIANSLVSTKGELNGASFSENNFEYNEEEKKLKISVQNLVSENGEVSWKDGVDEYKVIFIYEELTEEEKNIVLNSKVSFDIYGKEETVEKAINTEVTLNENLGNINEIEVIPETREIFKNFMYANSEYETEYKLDWNLNIGYAEISDKIIISDSTENFVNADQEKISVNQNTYYKQTIINRVNFEKILGEDGYIKILNGANEELAYITFEPEEDENIIVNYENIDINKIKIETSKSKTEGTLKIQHVKAIKPQTEYEKELIKTFASLENEVNLSTIYNKVIETNSEEEQELEGKTTKTEEIEILNVSDINSINLLEPVTKVGITLNKEALVTGSINEDVELYLNLINNEEKYSLFVNPVFDIKLPEELDFIQIKDIKLVFEEELQVQNTELFEDENGIKHIRIILSGIQTKYNIENIITGAGIIITADIGLKDIVETKQANIEVICINENEEVSEKTEVNLIKIEVPEVEEEVKPEEEENPEVEEEQGIPDENKPEIEEEIEVPEDYINGETEVPEKVEEEIEENLKQEEEIIEEVVNNNILRANVVIESDKGESAVLKWGEIVTYKVSIKNYGETLKNSKLKVDLPEGLTYMAEEEAFEPLFYEPNPEVRTITWNLEELLVGREIIKEFKAMINKDVTNIAINAQVIDGESEKIKVSNTITNECKQGNVSVQLETNMKGIQIGVDDTFNYQIKVKEILGKNLSNVIVELPLPEGTNYLNAYIIEGKNAISENIKINNNIVEIKIEELLANEEKYIVVELDAKNILEIENKEINTQVKVNADGIEEFLSNISTNKLSKPTLEIKEYSNLENNEIKAGNIIKHVIEIKNVGVGTAENIKIEDNFSEGVKYLNTIYTKNGKLVENKNYDGSKSKIITSLNENETLIAVVTMQAPEKSDNIENFVQVSAKGIETIKTEKDTYKIVNSNNASNNTNQNNNSENSNLENNNQETDKARSDISGIIWLDKNKNGIKELEEDKLGNTEVYLINMETQVQMRTQTNSDGKYIFNNENGKYMIVAVYDESKYSLTKSFVSYADSDMISKGVRAEAQVNNQKRVVAIIENINIQDADVSNLNIGLIENEVFDLSLNKVVDSVTVTTNKGTTSYKSNKKLAKVEIHAKEIVGAVAKITYRFDVKNEGDIQGTATKVFENMPEGLNIDLNENPGWKIDKEGRLYNDSLVNQTINPGETKSIYVTFTKTMTEDNTGIINNIAEIGESYNNLGIKDKDSVSGNNSKNEDDLSYADVYIGIKTGKTILYISLGLSMLIVLSTGIYLINKKVLQY